MKKQAPTNCPGPRHDSQKLLMKALSKTFPFDIRYWLLPSDLNPSCYQTQFEAYNQILRYSSFVRSSHLEICRHLYYESFALSSSNSAHALVFHPGWRTLPSSTVET